jgi:DNA-binding GntR family transcriptional regulator
VTEQLAVRGGGSKDKHATARVVDALKRMIVSGELLPGQAIRQESMAGQLGVSRLPVREGLRQLEAERLVHHVPNAGYVVAKLSTEEFKQVYLMRHVLEAELIAALPQPCAQQMSELEALCTEIADAGAALDLTRMQLLNHEFHFRIFAMSGLDLIVSEVERIWTWAFPYNAVYLYDGAARERTVVEHREMLVALGAGDNQRFADLMSRHRRGSESYISRVFRPGTPFIPAAGGTD